MAVPKVSVYYDYGRANYGSNAIRLALGELDVYFSYRTPVAFYSPEVGMVARKNDWGPTTGKHIRAAVSRVTNHDTVDGHTFEEALEEEIEVWRSRKSKSYAGARPTPLKLAIEYINQAYRWMDKVAEDKGFDPSRLSVQDREYLRIATRRLTAFAKKFEKKKKRKRRARPVAPVGRFESILI